MDGTMVELNAWARRYPTNGSKTRPTCAEGYFDSWSNLECTEKNKYICQRGKLDGSLNPMDNVIVSPVTLTTILAVLINSSFISYQPYIV